MSPTFRAGIVALIGRPNVGKSTLLNALLGQKIAIVSPKPQTTRTRITAILHRPEAQLVLVDTPGMTRGVDVLRRIMRRICNTAAADADVGLVVVETRGCEARISEADHEVVRAAKHTDRVLAINKIDRIDCKDELLPWMDAFARQMGIDAIVPISARTGDGLERLVSEIVARLPESPPLFPEDMITDQAERAICAELVREQLLLATRQEVPHAAAVVIEEFDDQRDEPGGRCRLTGRIYVERDSQRRIVIGKGGRQIKAISIAARREIEKLLACDVYLRLTVHVDKNWRQSERAVARLGYGDT